MLNLEDKTSTSEQTASAWNLDTLPFPIVLGALTIATLLKFLMFKDYLGSSFLFQDDTIFLGHYLFGVPIESPPTQDLYFGLVNIFTAFGGVFAAKCLLLLIQIAMGLLFYLIVNVFARASFVSLMLAVMFVHFPVAIDQNFFVIGAHPQFGMLMLIWACYLLLVGPFLERSIFSGKSLISLAGASLLIFAGLRSSPTLVLVPLVVFFAVVFLLVRDGLRAKFDARHIYAAVVLSAIPAFVLINGGEYHYSAIEGWTDVSLNQVLSNFAIALYRVLEAPFGEAIWLKLIWIASLLVFINILARAVFFRAAGRFEHTNSQWAFMVFLLALAAVLFGPGSIVTNYLDRYVIAPYYTSALLIACLLGLCVRNIPRTPTLRRTVHAIYVLPLTATATLWFSGHSTNQVLEPYEVPHARTVAALNEIEVADNDQIVMLHSDARGLATSGFNHWSTWYLRVLTNNPSVIGLVGTHAMYDPSFGSVFVAKYKDHDSGLWSTRDGRSSRIRMKGLEIERPIHVFMDRGDGVLAPTDAIVSNLDADRRRVRFGARFEDGTKDGVFNGELCETIEREKAAILSAAPANSAADAILASIVSAPVERTSKLLESSFSSTDGRVKRINLEVERGDLVEINLGLVPREIDSGNAPYSDTFPPMPVLSSAIAIYHTGDAFTLNTREDPSQSFRVPLKPDAVFQIKMIGCVGGKAAIFVNDQALGQLSGFMPNGVWSLGKGFLERSWSGQITTFEFSQYESDNKD